VCPKASSRKGGMGIKGGNKGETGGAGAGGSGRKFELSA